MNVSKELRNARVRVPSDSFRHVKAKNGSDWYVQELGLVADDGLNDRFELWHRKQADLLPKGDYMAVADGAYVKEQRMQLRTAFIPAPIK